MLTFADDDVTLEVNPVALWELEHGVEFGLGGALKAVVLEFGQNVGIRTTETNVKHYNYLGTFKNVSIFSCST